MATSVNLETLFSDIAPVQTAFVVTEHGTGVAKVVRYVSFALKEDAEGCYTEVEEEGLSMAGRKICVQWADKRKGKEEGASAEEKESPLRRRKSRLRQPGPRTPKTLLSLLDSGTQDPDLCRTLVPTPYALAGFADSPTRQEAAGWNFRQFGGAPLAKILPGQSPSPSLFPSPVGRLS
ncbi:hypothetical protein EST38_g13475 [Candolleomyces aberdarensis]|uniref:Uncharacterized protein n=1 Tax=Candolleomyces aberdarensis TaxID=2316362 RepID=A0A4Q2D0W8_9AGAR|nr:hypothetical protein EST38_g13475 [Candolleomyces aberdarensis]